MSKVHLGTIGWSYDFWKGPFYPPNMASKDFLAHYSAQFGAVEVDSTFYRVPNAQTLLSWKEKTPEDFSFSLKFPQIITHIKRLQNCQNETETFLNRASLLGRKLGPLLLQFPPNFSATKRAELENYIQNLPNTYRYAVEVRNKSWLTPEFYLLLKRYGVAFAWAENPNIPNLSEKTANFLYIRWEGNRKLVKGTEGKIEVDRKADLTTWAQKIKSNLEESTEVFGFFGKYFSGYPPSDVIQLETLLGTNIKQKLPLEKGQSMDINKLFELATPILEKNDFGVSHTKRVFELAKQHFPVRPDLKELTYAAIILHDIGGCTIKDQYQKGPPIAAKLLKQLNCTDEFIEQVCSIISTHHDHPNTPSEPFQTLYDADKLVMFSPEEYPTYNSREGFDWDKIVNLVYTQKGRDLALKALNQRRRENKKA